MVTANFNTGHYSCTFVLLTQFYRCKMHILECTYKCRLIVYSFLPKLCYCTAYNIHSKVSLLLPNMI